MLCVPEFFENCPTHTLADFLDHVYFVHPSIDVSVDQYRPTLDRYIDRDMSVDMLTDISAECRSMYRPTVGQYLGRYSARHSADTLTIDCRWNIGRLSYNILWLSVEKRRDQVWSAVFNVKIVLLSRATNSFSSGNLSAFDVISSKAHKTTREVAPDNTVVWWPIVVAPYSTDNSSTYSKA